ncbi:MAG TPA: hypothetical protein PLU11_10040 [Chitinophagaceae bacterium]|nr:hypothetical protein [Chitinophagaceae bacterium]HPH30697.1 hypothetical protein [Chitinophagaceae bacterium]HPN59506.1 hypothetical protein [Chitinophagaceae bacterium]
MKHKTHLLLLTTLLLTSTLYSQISDEKIMGAAGKIAHDYFRVSPFNKDFSTFVSRLMNDPSVQQSTIRRKTDTTLFFLEGIYSTHKPFFFRPDKVKIILSERETEGDSINPAQPFFLYQIVGYAPPGKEGKTDVQDEYEKLVRQYKRAFDMNHPRELKDGDTLSGEIRDFYFENVSFPVMTLAWSTNEINGNVLAITIRFFVYDNRAFLPIAAYRF